MRKFDNLSICVHEDDKKAILKACLSRVINRQQALRDKCVGLIDQSLTAGGNISDVQTAIKSMVDSFVLVSEEFAALEDFISYVILSENPSQTEVLKDLSNLEKDSL